MNRVSVNYDMKDIIENLPKGSHLISSSIRVLSVNSPEGRNVIVDTSNPTGGFQVEIDKFPVLMEAKLTVKTSSGLIELERKIPITSAAPVEKTAVVMDVKDFSNNLQNPVFTQKHVNEELALSICHLRQKVDHLRDIYVSDQGKLRYPSKDINTIIQTLSYHLSLIMERIDNIGAEKVLVRTCDDECKEKQWETTLQGALNELGDATCSSLRRIKILEDQVKDLTQRLDACCFGGSGGSSGGGGSGGGAGSGGSSQCRPGMPCWDNNNTQCRPGMPCWEDRGIPDSRN